MKPGRSCLPAGCTAPAWRRLLRRSTAKMSRSSSAISRTFRPIQTSCRLRCRSRTASVAPSRVSRATSCAGSATAPSGSPTKYDTIRHDTIRWTDYINEIFNETFRTSNIDIINDCRSNFSFMLPSEIIEIRKAKFEGKFHICNSLRHSFGL